MVIALQQELVTLLYTLDHRPQSPNGGQYTETIPTETISCYHENFMILV